MPQCGILKEEMMDRYKTTAVGAVLFCSLVAAAQIAQPAPAPELKKLDYFAGTWASEATIQPGPWGAGGKFTDNVSAEWMKGNFFLVIHSDFSMPADMGGAGSGVAIIGYDPDKKVYTEDRFESSGRHVVVSGTLNGDTWTWTGANDYNGMTIQSRLTLKMISPTSYTSKFEISADGGANWMPFWDGKGTKK
jgi:hypothetical protein